MEDLICPYCGKTQIGHEPDQISAIMCYTQCEYCDKHFWYSVEVKRYYNSRKEDDQETEANETER